MLPGFKLVDLESGRGCQIWDLAAGNIEIGNRQFDGRDRFISRPLHHSAGSRTWPSVWLMGDWEIGHRFIGRGIDWRKYLIGGGVLKPLFD